MKWKWVNVPIPVQHLLGLIVGAVLQLQFKQRLFTEAWIGYVIGLPLIILGVGIATWAVGQAGEINIEKPASLLTDGPYALSRNPMYVAWTMLNLCIGLAANSPWITALLSLATAFTHIFDIPREEKFLEKNFGDTYLQYKTKVRRYF